jgi:hypothetical protein
MASNVQRRRQDAELARVIEGTMIIAGREIPEAAGVPILPAHRIHLPPPWRSRRSRRCTSHALVSLAALALGSTGCGVTGAPWFSVFGAYFPAWMVCALIGIASAVLVRAIFVAVGIDALMALRLLTYAAIGVLFGVGSWQLWFGA